MTHEPTNDAQPDPVGQTGDRAAFSFNGDDLVGRMDLLISRLVDGSATAVERAEFEAHAADNAAAWRSLARTQSQELALTRAVNDLADVAEGVPLPTRAPASNGGYRIGHRLSMWTGWAVAAAVALAWSGGIPGLDGLRPGGSGETSRAGVIPAGMPVSDEDEAVQAYLKLGQQSGRVMGEVPERVLLSCREVDAGRMEVLFIRQFVERATMSDLKQVQFTDSGDPTFVEVKFIPAAGAGRPN